MTHGQLAREFVAALEHVIGPQQNIVTVCMGPEDDMELHRNEIVQGIREVDKGRGVVLMTDMFGGTPSNLAISVMSDARVEVIAGVNLPMLIKFSSVRESESLADAVASAHEAGRKSINVASSLIKDAKHEAG